jgi:hypothetical protein
LLTLFFYAKDFTTVLRGCQWNHRTGIGHYSACS